MKTIASFLVAAGLVCTVGCAQTDTGITTAVKKEESMINMVQIGRRESNKDMVILLETFSETSLEEEEVDVKREKGLNCLLKFLPH